jgi:hypothetical protein
MDSPEEESQIGKALGKVPAKWGLFMAVASFFVYVIGYLALRFKLTALGIGTDLLEVLRHCPSSRVSSHP